MKPDEHRAGRWISQSSGYRAFVPAPLPPDPPLSVDGEMASLLSKADRAVGRLDGAARVLPNPDLFVAMYVRQEAVLSSQIEGTQSTLEDVLAFEADGDRDRPKDVHEVVNYVRAMNHGLDRLPVLPLSLRLLREIHEQLMRDVRGEHRDPGNFRTSQNWIGPENCTLANATFVPPPPHELSHALGNLETFLHAQDDLPILIRCGLAHAQFETIHPFLDGNGRVGRLLITLMLCEREVLARPLLYLSIYLKANRAEYYDRLTAIRRRGDWEGWMRFFLQGVYEVSQSATSTIDEILRLQAVDRVTVQGLTRSEKAMRLLDFMFEFPILSVELAKERLECAYVTANKLIAEFEGVGLLEEITGNKRNRRFRYTRYLDLFHRS